MPLHLLPHLLPLALATAFAIAPDCHADPERFAFSEMLMGMQFRVVVYAPDEQSANRAVSAAFRRILQLNTVCSDYDADSELSRLCATAGTGQAVALSDDLFRVLTASQTLAERTDGAFDPTVGPLTRLWRRSRRSRQLPAPEVLEKARQAVGWKHLEIDPQRKTAQLKRPGMQLDLGGIAVGFAIDEALKVLKAEGIQSALIDGSGDIGVSDAPPGTAGWKIGVAPLDADKSPSRYLLLKNRAVTTSGDAFQFVEIDGVRYSHIVDPRTGLGLTTHSSVTLIAPTCIVADSHATAVCVLGPDRGLEFVEKQTPGAEALFVLGAGDGHPEPSIRETAGFSRFQAPPVP